VNLNERIELVAGLLQEDFRTVEAVESVANQLLDVAQAKRNGKMSDKEFITEVGKIHESLMRLDVKLKEGRS
jgi:hypothetical protein